MSACRGSWTTSPNIFITAEQPSNFLCFGWVLTQTLMWSSPLITFCFRLGSFLWVQFLFIWSVRNVSLMLPWFSCPRLLYTPTQCNLTRLCCFSPSKPVIAGWRWTLCYQCSRSRILPQTPHSQPLYTAKDMVGLPDANRFHKLCENLFDKAWSYI